MLTFFRKKNSPEQIAAEKLYASVLTQSRQPVFYTDYQVPDTLDGRFDMVLLHSFIVMRRLGKGDEASRRLSQALYDVMFVDMDRAVREIGIGDLSVGKHVRRMMKAFNGRMDAYEKGLTDSETMKDSLRRNLYGTVKDEVPAGILERMAAYLTGNVARIDSEDISQIATGKIIWSEPVNLLKKSA